MISETLFLVILNLVGTSALRIQTIGSDADAEQSMPTNLMREQIGRGSLGAQTCFSCTDSDGWCAIGGMVPGSDPPSPPFDEKLFCDQTSYYDESTYDHSLNEVTTTAACKTSCDEKGYTYADFYWRDTGSDGLYHWCDCFQTCNLMTMKAGWDENYWWDDVWLDDTVYALTDHDGITVPACDSSSSGDPHVKNVMGEKMDVNKMGHLTLAKFPPRNSSNTFVSVEGDIESYGDMCAPKFLTTIDIYGSWLHKKLSFRSESIMSGSPFAILLDGTDVWSSAEKCNPTVKCTLFEDNSISLTGLAKNANETYAALTIHGPSQEAMHISITHYTWQDMGQHKFFNYPHLDIQVSNLSPIVNKFGLDGILGQPAEDFKDWVQMPKQCQTLTSQRSLAPQWRGSILSASLTEYP